MKERDHGQDGNDKQDGQDSKSSSNSNSKYSDDNYLDLANLDDTWNRLHAVRVKDKFTLWGTVDRWGPGAIAILTLLLVACIGWMYSARIAAIEADLRHIEEKHKELIQRIYVKELKDQNLRDYLLKKGVIE